MKISVVFLFAFSLALSISAQPGIQWQRSYGGSDFDIIYSIEQTNDGGYIMAGIGTSVDGDISGNIINDDFWVVKLSSNGTIQWQRSIDGNGATGNSVHQTIDGGYIVAGKMGAGFDGPDFLVVKLTPSGETEWERTYGGTEQDVARCVKQTIDGGYIVAGTSNSNDGDVTGNHGEPDFWVLKLSASGELQWQTSLGGSDWDLVNSIDQTLDGGFIVGGSSSSNDGDVSFNKGEEDCWIVKLTNNGSIEWEKSIGGSDEDKAASVQQTFDGGFVIGGSTRSIDGDVTENQGLFDFWLIKLNENGDIQWQKTFGGSGSDRAYSMKQTDDGGFIIVGESHSNNGDVGFNYGSADFWVVKTDSLGNIEWRKTLGGSLVEYGYSVDQTNDGGVVVAGLSQSIDGNLTQNNGGNDGWVVKLTFLTSAITGKVHIDPEGDCAPDVAEEPLSGLLVQSKGDYSTSVLTDSNGYFFIPVDSGDYEVSVNSSSFYWEICNAPVNVAVSNDTTVLDFPAQIIRECPLLDVTISTPFLRRCFDNTYFVSYCNYGTITAEDVYIEISLDSSLIYQTSTIPFSVQNGNTLTFELDSVDIGECGSFQITAYLDCDSTSLGQTHCSEAHIYPDSLCLPVPSSWDGSNIEVEVECVGDSVFFHIQNTGSGDMSNPLEYIIIEDEIVLLHGDFDLEAGQDTTIALLATGSTFHLEAEQSPDHPTGTSSTGATIEGCGDWLSLGFFTQFANADDSPFIDIDCQENIGSYDPNDKQASPVGFGDDHLIEPQTELEYLIRFQNTGTDTAFKVVVVDVLPEELDLTTLRPGASSHSYEYSVSSEGWPIFTFDDIMLPDSNVNEAASHGFVRFKIAQTEGNGHGTYIENTALIYFDFNAPIQTNVVKHKVGQIFPWTLVGTETVLRQQSQFKIMPNPLTDSALLQLENVEEGLLNLLIVSPNGQVVREETAFGTGFEIQRGALPSGIYFFKIKRDGAYVGSGKLMVK